MNFLPELDTVKRFAESGKYDILPVSCEILSDICTPIEAIMKLKSISTHCYMLESVADDLDFYSKQSLLKLTSYIEPVMIVVMAVIVGFVIISIIQPIYQSYQTIGAGS